MAKFTYDHLHLRSPNPEATAAFCERMFAAEVIWTTQQGSIDLKLGGANVFIAEVHPDAKVNPPPQTPNQGLEHLLSVNGIDARLLARARRRFDRAPGAQARVKGGPR